MKSQVYVIKKSAILLSNADFLLLHIDSYILLNITL